MHAPRRPAPSSNRILTLLLTIALLLPPALLFAQQTDLGWPRDIPTPGGTLTIYQPQAETLQGNVLTGRAAASYLKTGGKAPVFGVYWFTAQLAVDRDNRNAELSDVQVTQARFPQATPDQEQEAIALLQKQLPQWTSQPISMDRLIASLETAQAELKWEEGLNNAPPKIIISDQPSVLVIFDGQPALRDIPGTKLQKVINTPFPIIYDPASATYYLTNTNLWYSAKDALGPWQSGATPPAEVAAAIPKDAKGQAADDTNPLNALTPPQILTSTEPAELVWTDGKPQMLAVTGGGLNYAQNTDSDLFYDPQGQSWYVLLSGRWYKAPALQGPWTFVKPSDLPVTFQGISPGGAKAHVRASVPGTSEAKDALMDTQIPQTAAVKRGPAPDVTVAYDGDPQFKPISGSKTLEYAVNSAQEVLKQGTQYFLCKDGVWYVSDGAKGPWAVSDTRPADVESIPANNPLYNTKYVQVYNSTPDTVYVGYTPGYTGSYPYYGTVVYGTGWYTPGWVGAYYYPWAWTYGWGAFWTPYWGWGMGAGFGWGFGWGFAWGAGWNAWGWGGGCWGPAGVYNSIAINNWLNGTHPNASNWSGTHPNQGGGGKSKAPANNLYNRGGNAGRNVTADQRGKAMQNMGYKPRGSQGKPNDVFAGKNGDVFRKTGDGWQQRGQNGWNKVGEGGGDRGLGGGQGTGGFDRGGGMDRGAGSFDRGGMGGLNNDWQARQRGAYNAQAFGHGGWGGGSGGYRGGGGFGGYRGGAGGFHGGGGRR